MDSGAKVKNTFILSARIKSGACHKNQRNTNIKRPAMRLAASSLIETNSPAPTFIAIILRVGNFNFFGRELVR